MKELVSKFGILLFAVLLLSSCMTSKATMQVMDSFDYGIKIVHCEQTNSTYNNLVSDFYEGLKTTDEKFAEQFAKDTMLFMSKGACLGRCPVYRITIYNSGKVKYEGVNNVDLVGIFESKLEGNQQANARKLIEKIELPRMYSRYPKGVNMVSDVATTKLVISDGLIKFPTLISYGQPDEIKNIEVYLEKLVKDLSWVQI